VLTLVVALLIMLAVVWSSLQWAVRAERRRDLRGEGRAGDHR